MRRSRKSTWTVPWWVWLILGIVAFAAFRGLAGLKPGSPGPEAMGRALWIGLGKAGQVVAPILFGLFALISALSQVRRKALQGSTPDYRPGNGPESDRIEPTIGANEDLYQFWKEAPDIPVAPPQRAWTSELLRALEWRRLEQLCGEYFRTLRFRVEEAGSGPDGGIDLRLYAEGGAKPGILVQCKSWNSWKVGVKELRELYGVMAAEGVDEGIFVTTSTFSNEAVEFGRGKPMTLIDGGDLLRKLKDLPADDQDRLLRFATNGDFTTPTCPSCGYKMVRRSAEKTRQAFWGCPRFPRCRAMIRIRNGD